MSLIISPSILRVNIMKKIVIIDGNSEDESKVKGLVGSEYDVTSTSVFEINNMVLSTVITIANTLDAADAYSGGRSLRVAVCARDIARNLGWDEKECQNIYFVALLHDIGMITVTDMILHKPGRLTEEEYEVVKNHPQKGAEMLRDIDVLSNLSDGVLYHHERWDGKGYPKGLAGEEVPLFARVIAIADAYVAMSSDRVYRSRLTTDKIISEFTRCRGGQFDPDIVDVFVFMLKDGYSVDPSIGQTKEASERAIKEGGFRNVFGQASQLQEMRDGEMDALTGLFTRSYLNTRVGNKISEERSGALMIIEITGFDVLKEKLGSDGTDEFLKLFSDALRSFFREADVVSRVSAGRFAVFVSGESGKGVIEKKAGMIVSVIDDREELSKYRNAAGVAIGISMCQEDGVTFEELYGVASVALEEAKQAGETGYRFRDIR